MDAGLELAGLCKVPAARGYKAWRVRNAEQRHCTLTPETQPEFLDAYEVGLKRDFGRTLRINGALFYYDYAGMQIPLSVQPPAGPPISELVNLNSRAYGFEVEGAWTLSDNLQFFLNYAHLNAKVRAPRACLVDDADPLALQPGANTAGCPTGSQNVAGQTIPQSPPNKVVFGGSYTLRLASGTLTYSADFAWTDRTYYSIFNRPYNLAPAYDTVDLRMILSSLDGRYTAILYAKNILNSLGYDNASAGLNGDGTIGRSFGLTAPATYGVELQYRFR